MQNIDRIRSYILERKTDGTLKPGDKLPSYAALTEMFHVSYQTVASILNKLDKEGLVETRKGSGSYLRGANRLNVLINIQPTTVSIADTRKLLNKHLANAELYLDLDLQPMQKLADPREQQAAGEKYRAAVSMQPALVNEQQLPPATLTQFADYPEVMRSLKTVPGMTYEYALPFMFHTYQIGVNRRLLAEAGFSLEELTPDFNWWNRFAANCRKRGILPASVDYEPVGPLLFRALGPLLLCFTGYDEDCFKNGKPLFDTPAGHRFLNVLRDTELISDGLNDPRSFYRNGAVFGWRCGSWLTVQNLSPERPDKAVDDLAFLPYRTPDGKKISVFDPVCLMAFLRYDTTPDERNRVWELMRILLSRDFQIDYCGLGGVVSANRDILPNEYRWNRRGKHADFFPGRGGKVVYPRLFFSMSQVSMLSVLLENWKLFGASAAETLMRMELKKHFYRTNLPKSVLNDSEVHT